MQEQIEAIQLSAGVSPASSVQMKAPSERAPRGKYAGGVLEHVLRRWNWSMCLHLLQWTDKIFEEQPYLANVYPGDTRNIGIIFCIDTAEIEYFNLGVNQIFRETYRLGNVKLKEKGYFITESCIGCGICREICPQRCIEEGEPFMIQQNHCIHCGNCYENCPVKAIERRGRDESE